MSTTTYASNLVQVTVKTGAILSDAKNGFLFQYAAGDQLYVPADQVTFLRQRGIIV